MRLSPLQIGGEVCGLLLISTAGGGVLGALYEPGMFAEFAAFFGAVVGFLFSPILIIALFRRNWLFGAAIAYLPAGLVSLLAGRLLGESDFFLLGVASVVMVWAIGAIVARIILPDRYADPMACRTCGYDMRAQYARRAEHGGRVRCPECGWSPTE